LRPASAFNQTQASIQKEALVMSERILSNDEIAEMEKLTVDRLNEAIDAGDKDGAKKIAKRMYNEFLAMHDLYRNWAVATLSFIGKVRQRRA
jgi:uncharacterized Fe-S cluster-containing radical SAM superfamily enzyme